MSEGVDRRMFLGSMLPGMIPFAYSPPALQTSTATFNVRDYGARGTGSSTADVAPIRACVAAARSAAAGGVGALILFPKGSYYSDEILLDVDGMSIAGQGFPIIRARTNNQKVIRVAASWCRVSNLQVGAGDRTGVTGIALEHVAEVLTRSDFNLIEHILIFDCAEGITLRAGGNAGSSCFFNTFLNIHLYRVRRGIWFRVPTRPAATQPNRNFFYGVRCGQEPINTGVQIDAGDNNAFFGLECEGIHSGTSPNAVPTSLKIANMDPVSGLGNASNRFFGFCCENDTNRKTYDIDNDNGLTEFYGATVQSSKVTGTAPWGGLSLAADTSQVAITLGFHAVNATRVTFRENSEPSADRHTLDAYEEGSFTPTVTSGITRPRYGAQSGTYVRIGKLVQFQLTVTVVGGTRTVDPLHIGGLPLAAEAASMHGGHWTSAVGIVPPGNPLPLPRIPGASKALVFRSTSGADVRGADLHSPTPEISISGSYFV